jgi:hypothetical protein
MNEEDRYLDRDEVTNLSIDLLKAIRRHYDRRPRSRDTVFEVLNALAITAATVCSGTEDPAAIRYFLKSLRLQRRAKP